MLFKILMFFSCSGQVVGSTRVLASLQQPKVGAPEGVGPRSGGRSFLFSSKLLIFTPSVTFGDSSLGEGAFGAIKPLYYTHYITQARK